MQRRITLENDDKTFTALETLRICQQVGTPMVLDVHYHQVNNAGEAAVELWPQILKTWEYNPADNSPSEANFAESSQGSLIPLDAGLEKSGRREGAKPSGH